MQKMEMETETEKLKVQFKCIAKSCGNEKIIGSNLSFYSLPDEPERVEQWLIALGRPDLLGYPKKIKTARVCGDHFGKDVVLGSSRRLTRTAVPMMKDTCSWATEEYFLTDVLQEITAEELSQNCEESLETNDVLKDF